MSPWHGGRQRRRSATPRLLAGSARVTAALTTAPLSSDGAERTYRPAESGHKRGGAGYLQARPRRRRRAPHEFAAPRVVAVPRPVGTARGGRWSIAPSSRSVVDVGAPQRRSPDRRRDRANSDAERRALAKASGRRTGPAARAPRPGYAVPSTDDGSRRNPGPAAIGYVLAVAEGTLLAAHGEAIGSRGRTSPSTALCWPPSYTPAGSAWAGSPRGATRAWSSSRSPEVASRPTRGCASCALPSARRRSASARSCSRGCPPRRTGVRTRSSPRRSPFRPRPVIPPNDAGTTARRVGRRGVEPEVSL